MYNIIFAKAIWQEKMYMNIFRFANLLLSTAMIAGVTKMYCVHYVEPRDAYIITHATPLVVMLFATIFLREKMILKYWLYGALSFIGVCIYISKKLDINGFYYGILFLHVIFKATTHIAVKKVSKQSTIQVMFYDDLFFSIFAVFYLSQNGGFDYKMYFNWQILLIIVVSSLAMFSFAKSYKLAKNGITKLQNLDFSKIIFTFILAVLFLDDKIETNELVGSGVIILSIVLSQVEFKAILKSKTSKKKS